MQRIPHEDSEDVWEAVGIVGWLASRVQEGMVRKLGGSEEAARLLASLKGTPEGADFI